MKPHIEFPWSSDEPLPKAVVEIAPPISQLLDQGEADRARLAGKFSGEIGRLNAAISALAPQVEMMAAERERHRTALEATGYTHARPPAQWHLRLLSSLIFVVDVAFAREIFVAFSMPTWMANICATPMAGAMAAFGAYAGEMLAVEIERCDETDPKGRSRRLVGLVAAALLSLILLLALGGVVREYAEDARNEFTLEAQRQQSAQDDIRLNGQTDNPPAVSDSTAARAPTYVRVAFAAFSPLLILVTALGYTLLYRGRVRALAARYDFQRSDKRVGHVLRRYAALSARRNHVSRTWRHEDERLRHRYSASIAHYISGVAAGRQLAGLPASLPTGLRTITPGFWRPISIPPDLDPLATGNLSIMSFTK